MFHYITPLSYWVLTALWLAILMLYLGGFRRLRSLDATVAVLLVVLMIDAFRTLFESLYFGFMFNSQFGLLPPWIGQTLAQPHLLIIPKIINVIAGILVIVLLIRRWLPREFLNYSTRLEALRASEQRFQDLAAHVPGIVFQYLITSLEVHRFVYVSNRTDELLGLPAGEIMNDHTRFMAMIEADDRQRWTRSLDDSSRRLAHWEWEGRFQRREDGQIRWFRATAQPRRLANGDTEWNGILLDVTDKIQAEHHLRESERKFRGLFDQAQEMIHLVNREGQLLDANPMELSTLRYSRDQLMGLRLGSIIHPDYRGMVQDAVARAFDGIVINGLEAVLITRDNQPIYIEANIVPNRSAGRVDYVRMMMRDITERKAAETELRNYREHLEELVEIRTAEMQEKVQMIDQVSNAVIGTDLDGNITAWNRGAELMFGYSAQQAIGQSIALICPEVFRAQLTIRLLDPVRQKGYVDLEISFVKRNGQNFYGHLSCSTVKNPQEIVVGMVAYIVDITPAKMAEADLRAAKEQAELASQAKSEFLSRMSHELRTPMNAILGFAQLLEMEIPDKQQRKNAHEIVHAGRHLLALINEILDLSHIESGKLKLSIETVNLAEVLRECLAIIKPLAIKRDIRILESITSQPFLSVTADAMRLKQIILNLLSNAVKYNRDGGSVTLHCTAVEPDRVRLDIRDSGPGLDLTEQQQLFLPFERLGAQHSDVEGTGIGLVISKRLVEMMGGSIAVESRKGDGSMFSIVLYRGGEVHLAPPERMPPAEFAAEEVAAGKDHIHRVLYIEDNAANLRLMEQIFRLHPGAQLLTAARPQLGLDLAFAHAPDLILLDINLPDMDGYEVKRRLAENAGTKGIPVVAVSANAMPKDITYAEAQGFAAYLAKPIRVDDLQEILIRYLRIPVS